MSVVVAGDLEFRPVAAGTGDAADLVAVMGVLYDGHRRVGNFNNNPAAAFHGEKRLD